MDRRVDEKSEERERALGKRGGGMEEEQKQRSGTKGERRE